MEQVERQKSIQMLKDKLVYKSRKGEQKTDYEAKEVAADEGTTRLTLGQKHQALEQKLQVLRQHGA